MVTQQREACIAIALSDSTSALAAHGSQEEDSKMSKRRIRGFVIVSAVVAMLAGYFVAPALADYGYIRCSLNESCTGYGCWGDEAHFFGCHLQCYIGDIPLEEGECGYVFPA